MVPEIWFSFPEGAPMAHCAILGYEFVSFGPVEAKAFPAKRLVGNCRWAMCLHGDEDHEDIQILVREIHDRLKPRSWKEWRAKQWRS